MKGDNLSLVCLQLPTTKLNKASSLSHFDIIKSLQEPKKPTLSKSLFYLLDKSLLGWDMA